MQMVFMPVVNAMLTLKIVIFDVGKISDFLLKSKGIQVHKASEKKVFRRMSGTNRKK